MLPIVWMTVGANITAPAPTARPTARLPLNMSSIRAIDPSVRQGSSRAGCVTMTGSHNQDDTVPNRCSKHLPCSAPPRHVGKRAGISASGTAPKPSDRDGIARSDGGAVHLHDLGTAAWILDPSCSGNC